jgi:glycerol-3-phosphate dehydrogenase (NAD(P)+)
MDGIFSRIGIIGAGSYGTALAQYFSTVANEIFLLSNSIDTKVSINKDHINDALNGVIINKNISCTTSYKDLSHCDLLFIAVPVSSVSEVSFLIKENNLKTPILLCSKGVDVENARLLSFCVEEIIDNELIIFSGPSFAHDVANGLPFGVNVAGKNIELAKSISRYLSSPTVAIKAIPDYIGLQIAGAFKNILAVGCGIKSGQKLGKSAIAKFIVEGFGEMMDLSIAMGGQKDTFLEFGGIGDILLTCTSSQSRNVVFGEYIASGGTLKSWTETLAEGAYAAKAIPTLEKKHNIKLNTFSEIYESIYR